jgi:hypothetical protein
MRNVIVTNELSADGDGGTALVRGLNRRELRMLVLLADKIDYPLIDYVPVPSTVEEGFLIDAGVIVRSEVSADRADYYDFIFGPHIRLLEDYQQSEPGKWSLASNGLEWRERALAGRSHEYGRTAIPKTDSREVLKISLFKSIPVPNTDVPYEDILNFKEKRYDQLLSLRFHIDDVYQAILAAPDKGLAELFQIERLDRSIKDQLMVMKECQLPFGAASLSASFNITAGVAAFVAALPLGTISAATLGVSAGAGVELAKSVDFRSSKGTDSAFRYVSSFHEELFMS